MPTEAEIQKTGKEQSAVIDRVLKDNPDLPGVDLIMALRDTWNPEWTNHYPLMAFEKHVRYTAQCLLSWQEDIVAFTPPTKEEYQRFSAFTGLSVRQLVRRIEGAPMTTAEMEEWYEGIARLQYDNEEAFAAGDAVRAGEREYLSHHLACILSELTVPELVQKALQAAPAMDVLASLCSVSVRTLHYWMTGEKTPSVENVKRLKFLATGQLLVGLTLNVLATHPDARVALGVCEVTLSEIYDAIAARNEHPESWDTSLFAVLGEMLELTGSFLPVTEYEPEEGV